MGKRIISPGKRADISKLHTTGILVSADNFVPADGYGTAQMPIVQMQLEKAGVRLAWILEIKPSNSEHRNLRCFLVLHLRPRSAVLTIGSARMKLTDYFAASRTNVLPSILELKAIDVDGIIKRMQLKRLAEERGKTELPATDSASLDRIEQDIINEVENEANSQFANYLEHQKTYAARASHTSVQGLAIQLGAIANDATTDFLREIHAGLDELHTAKRNVVLTEKEVEKFKAENRITRPPRDQGARAYNWGLFIFIVAIESVLNGFFLAKGSMFGFSGGFMMAFLISVINVLVSASVGRVIFPWLTHRKITSRIVAGAGSITFVVVAIGFNLAVAHYRNASASDPFEASAVAYQTTIRNPFGLYDFESWTLFVLGFCFSIVASIDGLRLDDPYPGYGRRGRQNLNAIVVYTHAKDHLLEALEDIARGAERKMDDIINLIRSRQSEASHITTESLALRAAMLQQFSHFEMSGNTLLRYYRDENSKARKTAPPGHFDTNWTYRRPLPDTVVVTNLDNASYETESRRAIEDAPIRREALHSAYIAAINEYRRVDDLAAVGAVQ